MCRSEGESTEPGSVPSEDRFRQLAEGLPQLIWTCEPDGTCDYLSPQWEAYTGLPSAAQYGDRWRTRVHPEDRARIDAAFGKALAEGQAVRAEVRLKRFDGAYRWFDARTVPLRDEGGRIVKWFGSGSDIHEERELREALRKERDRLAKVAAAVPGAINSFRVTGDGAMSFSFSSPSTKEVFGISPEALTADASPFLRRVYSEDDVRNQEAVAQSARMMSQFHSVYRFAHPTKGERWIDTCSLPVAESDGTITWHGYSRDVTEERQAEEQLLAANQALRESEEHFRTLIAEASDLITVLRADGVIEFQSPAALRVLGYRPGDMMGHSVEEWAHGDDLAALRTALVKATGEPGVLVTVATRFRHQDGTWRFLDSVGRALCDAQGETRVVMNSRDTTAAHRLEEQLRQVQKMEAVGRLAGGVAHDFNNILTVVLGNLSVLEDESNLSPSVREALAEIQTAAERAANLTQQLLAFSRRQSIKRRHLDLNQLVTNLARMLKRLLGEDIGMELHLCSQPVEVFADSGMLEQVLLNLAVNSRDAMPRGGRLVIETGHEHLAPDDVSLRVGTRPGRFTWLRVTDNGQGILPEVLGQVFEPFFTTKEVGHGTGLGLSTVHGIVEQHEGWIEVSSEPQQGTSFRVLLPQASASFADVPNAGAPSPVVRGSGTILLVEDEPAVRQLLCRLLTPQGYRVIEASTGVEALALWAEQGASIDLLFTDLVMPDGLGGFELSVQLKKERPNLPVIFASGYSPEIAGHPETFREGENFLSKPFELKRLLATLSAALRRDPGSA